MSLTITRTPSYGFDAVEASEWPTMRRFGLVPTLAYPEVTPLPFRDGVGRSEFHDRMETLRTHRSTSARVTAAA